MPALLVRALSERAEVFLSDHCQVGFAVMLIISAIPCYRMKKAQDLLVSGFGWVQPSKLYIHKLCLNSGWARMGTAFSDFFPIAKEHAI